MSEENTNTTETTTTQTTATSSAGNHVWANYGITWNAETVGKQNGPNKTDWVAYPTKAQIPTVSDYEKFVAHFGKPLVLAWLNASNSMRVKAQAVSRGLIESGTKDADTIRQGVYNALLGLRAQAAVHTVTIVKVTLPDGSVYEGSDEIEFRQMFAAALVGLGVPTEAAIAKAQTAELPRK